MVEINNENNKHGNICEPFLKIWLRVYTIHIQSDQQFYRNIWHLYQII